MHWSERTPQERRSVEVDGYEVITYSFGEGEDVILCLNGGPGLPCDYLREAHSCLVDEGFRVVAFDQLGTGASSRPTDASLWTIERYVTEVEAVRSALGLGKVHLLGHSWGGWLAIEYALRHPEHLSTLILESTVADIPHLTTELDRLRGALGSETVTMMQRHEAEGSFTHPEYMAAVTLLNYRHVCRLSEWPAPVSRSLDDWNMGPYNAIQGPNEFLYIGNLKDWNRVPDLHTISVPVLIVCGEHDELTPACAMRMKHAIPQAELHVVPNGSHMSFYENPDDYYPALLNFLGAHRASSN
jgi:proline iminopeptidase